MPAAISRYSPPAGIELVAFAELLPKPTPRPLNVQIDRRYFVDVDPGEPLVISLNKVVLYALIPGIFERQEERLRKNENEKDENEKKRKRDDLDQGGRAADDSPDVEVDWDWDAESIMHWLSTEDVVLKPPQYSSKRPRVKHSEGTSQ